MPKYIRTVNDTSDDSQHIDYQEEISYWPREPREIHDPYATTSGSSHNTSEAGSKKGCSSRKGPDRAGPLDGFGIDWIRIYPHTHARPQNALQVLSAWELPKIQESVRIDPKRRQHCGPRHRRRSTEIDHSPLLETIMAHHPTLRANGLTLILSPDFVGVRIAQFSRMLENKPSQARSARLVELLSSIERANHAMRKEATSSKATLTGLLRGTMYSVFNDFLAEPLFFKKEHRQTVGRLCFGDPATTTASDADVTGWSTQHLTSLGVPDLTQARSRVCIEHKFERDLRDRPFHEMEFKFGRRRCERYITISLSPKGGLSWSSMNGAEHAHLRQQICQVLTQIYCTKTSDGILFNTRHLRLFSRTKRIDIFHVSCLSERKEPRWNVDAATGAVNIIDSFACTPVLAFLAVLATSVDVPAEDHPHTKFKLRLESLTDEEQDEGVADGWTEAPEDSIPELKQVPLDIDIIAIAEGSAQSAEVRLDGPLPGRVLAPNESAVRSTAQFGQTAAQPDKAAPLRLIKYYIYDIYSELYGANVYSITLNAVWKSLLSAGPQRELRIVPEGSLRIPGGSTLEVEISDIISYGRLYATYKGRFADSTGRVIKVVIKLSYPDRYPEARRSQSGHTYESARDAVMREASLYTGELSGLQGTVVPRFFGVFVNDSGVLAMILERGGELVPGQEPRDLADLPSKAYQEPLREMYEQLHSAGVVHRDICVRHVLRAPDSDTSRKHKYWLIDFEGAVVPPRHRLKAFADSEMSRREALFNNGSLEKGICAWTPPKDQ